MNFRKPFKNGNRRFPYLRFLPWPPPEHPCDLGQGWHPLLLPQTTPQCQCELCFSSAQQPSTNKGWLQFREQDNAFIKLVLRLKEQMQGMPHGHSHWYVKVTVCIIMKHKLVIAVHSQASRSKLTSSSRLCSMTPAMWRWCTLYSLHRYRAKDDLPAPGGPRIHTRSGCNTQTESLSESTTNFRPKCHLLNHHTNLFHCQALYDIDGRQ